MRSAKITGHAQPVQDDVPRTAAHFLVPQRDVPVGDGGHHRMMKFFQAVTVAALLPTTYLSSVGPKVPKRASAQVVTVTAVDYGFEAPTSVAAGTVTLKLVNKGKELHHLAIAKLEQGHTIEDLQNAPPGPPPEWFKTVGGPNAPAVGGSSQATLNLEPGNYVLLCFIPSPDGTSHFMKGMMKPLMVTGASATPVEPNADVTMRLV